MRVCWAFRWSHVEAQSYQRLPLVTSQPNAAQEVAKHIWSRAVVRNKEDNMSMTLEP